MALKARIEKKKLILEIDLQEPRESASGKTMVIATTGGNKETEATFNGQKVVVGLNAYFKPKK